MYFPLYQISRLVIPFLLLQYLFCYFSLGMWPLKAIMSESMCAISFLHSLQPSGPFRLNPSRLPCISHCLCHSLPPASLTASAIHYTNIFLTGSASQCPHFFQCLCHSLPPASLTASATHYPLPLSLPLPLTIPISFSLALPLSALTLFNASAPHCHLA